MFDSVEIYFMAKRTQNTGSSFHSHAMIAGDFSEYEMDRLSGTDRRVWVVVVGNCGSILRHLLAILAPKQKVVRYLSSHNFVTPPCPMSPSSRHPQRDEWRRASSIREVTPT